MLAARVNLKHRFSYVGARCMLDLWTSRKCAFHNWSSTALCTAADAGSMFRGLLHALQQSGQHGERELASPEHWKSPGLGLNDRGIVLNTLRLVHTERGATP